MGCFTIQWLQQFLVWCVIVGAINILWAIVAIFVIYIVFALLSYLIGMGGVSLLPPHR